MSMLESNPRKPVSSARRRRTWQDASSSLPVQPATNSNGARSASSGDGSLRLPEFTTTGTNKTKAKWNIRDETLLTGLFLICVPILLYLLVTKWTFYRSDEIPLLIPRFMHSDSDDLDNYNSGDLGGWLVGSPLRYLPDLIPEPNDGLVDFGGLVFLSLIDPKRDFRRTIRKNDNKLDHEEEKVQIHQMDQEHISKRHWYDDELEDKPEKCRRLGWEKLHFPSCNSFHEVDLSRPYDAELAKRSGDDQHGQSFYISHGYFRDVFSLADPTEGSKAVLKVARYTKHEMNYRPLFNAKRDALIMERLTSSPNIVNIFGHCGSSVLVESLPHEVEEVIVPGGGWIKQEDLHDSKDVDVQNHYDNKERLSIAISMAESIAELHGFKDGVIVHDDIQLCQWLRNDKGDLKLGDFNRARLLAWDEKSQTYCKYDNGRSYGNYRSPEEYKGDLLSEKHDVWSFGNNIYALLSGLWIFYENEDDQVVADMVVNGTRPFIDPRYRNRSFIESRLVEIMEKCWVYDMGQRPEIFEILELLRQLKKESDSREKATSYQF